MMDLGDVVPLRVDMSDMVRQSVATLYSHLVTRPTGQALRLGIEAQLTELGAVCITVLDFTEVVVLDYSCADETVAKLVQRFLPGHRPAEAYFMVRGIDDRHRDTIHAVLARQDLAIAAEPVDGAPTLLGTVSTAEAEAWTALNELGRGTARDVATVLAESEPVVAGALESLARRRVVVRMDIPRTYFGIPSLLND